MNPRTAMLLAALLLASTGPALAAEPAAAAPPAAATQLARILMPKSTWSQGLDQLGKAVQMQMRGHPGSQLQYPPDFDAKVKSELEQVLPYDDLVAMHAKELSAAYTPAEIDGLVAFYGAPLGQKTLQMNQQVSEKVSQATQQRVQSKMPEVMKRLSALAKPSAAGSPHGGTAQQGGALPPGHPAMGGNEPAPAKKAPAPSTKSAAKPKAKGDAAKAKAKVEAKPKAPSEAAAPSADAAPKADAAPPKAEVDASAKPAN